MKRILSIDGGGIKGTFPASFLATIEEQLSSPIANYFDLIVGTSTGGIIALGLGLGLPAHEIVSLYEELGPNVFGGNKFVKMMRHLGLAKYSQTPLRNALNKHFDGRTLGDSKKRLVIPSLNLETGEVHVFKTSHHPRLERDYKEKMIDVALATAAAPTYFPTHHLSGSIPLVDGGMWANNPVGVAVVEAIGVLGWPRDELCVLSIGCTSSPLNVDKGRALPMGQLYWATRVADVFMSGQSSSAFGTAQLLAGHENIFRINPIVPEGRYSLDGTDAIPYLKGIGITEARKALPQLREKFFAEEAEAFTPCHA